MTLDGDNIVKLLNRNNKDIQSIPGSKDPVQAVNAKRRSLIDDMLGSKGADSTGIGSGAANANPHRPSKKVEDRSNLDKLKRKSRQGEKNQDMFIE